MSQLDYNSAPIAVIGLGYVGLPLAVEFGKIREVIGFDVNDGRIAALRGGNDATLEVDSDELQSAHHLRYTSDPTDLRRARIFIVTVPTPIDASKRPDLTPLLRATETIGKVLKVGDIVIYESTVYPGATEEDCVPVLEKISGLNYNKQFFCGYSPERINPGDKAHRLTSIKKVTSGSTPEIADVVNSLYEAIIGAGTHKAPSIRVAEAAKVIENTQRDLNIALVNELSIIFNRLGISTREVLEAAETKWNFIPFRPGLVGGHCIGVDPYYLTHKAETTGYYPHIILSGRRINDGMSEYIAQQTIERLIAAGIVIRGAKINILGITFKENCPDTRNSKVVDLIRSFERYGCEIYVHDPLADADEVKQEYGLHLSSWDDLPMAQALIVAVPHEFYQNLSGGMISLKLRRSGVFVDVKSAFPKDLFESEEYYYWSL